jgi:prevent-host-death family protein
MDAKMKPAMQIGAFEAKNRLSELLQLVENGQEVTITRHGKAVARLVPASQYDPARVKRAVEELKEMRKKHRLDGLTLRELIDGGRKY